MRRPLPLAFALLMATLAACGDPPPPRPLVVFAIDGASWKVLDPLLEAGRLPVLARLAEGGSRATLRTFHSQSPVIWTTVATGVRPERHGITGFVVPTAAGDVPVSSTMRRVPALWNMLSTLGRRVAVVGWWGTWPAEEVEGVLVSYRARNRVEDRVYPESWLPEIEAATERLAADAPGAASAASTPRDRLTIEVAQRLASEPPFALWMVYLNSVDNNQHRFWRYWAPARYAPLPEAELAEFRDRVPAAYEQADRALGRLLAVLGEDEVNVLVVSDHGVKPLRREVVRVTLDLDEVLHRLGYLEYADGGVDLARTRAFTYATNIRLADKRVRFALAGREPGGTVRPEEVAELRRRLEADLGRVRWVGGQPALELREPRNRPHERGADVVIEVREGAATPTLWIDGEPWEGGDLNIRRNSATHDARTHGVLIAAGPDIAAGVDLDGIHVRDIAPTVLYGVGAPVAEDFWGRAWTELFTPAFRRRHPLATLPTWGEREAAGPRASGADEELLEQLRALGYLD